MATVAEMFAMAVQNHQAGNLQLALQLYQQIIQADPGHADAHHLLGVLAYRMGRHDQAVGSIRLALSLKPRVAAYHFNLGLAHLALGRVEEARACFQEAVKLQPDFADAHNNLACAFLQLGKPDEAEAHFRLALRSRPDYADAHSGLGIALADQAKLDEAVTHFRQALRIRPDFAEVHSNLATALEHQGRLEEALAHFQQALRIRPGFPEVQQGLALQSLLRGDFEQGWPGYEWRWRLPSALRRSFPQPLWDGSLLGGGTILLYAEQGLGDTLQFIRYAPLVKQRGGKVIVECQPSLLRLLARAPGIDHLVAQGAPLPPFDVQAPLLSLPRILRTALATIPAKVPYLHADAELVKHWKSWKSEVGSRKSEHLHLTADIRHRTSDFLVGIAWQGNPAFRGDRFRSIPLSSFAPLAGLDGVQLISLQKGPGTDQLGWTVDGGRWTEQPIHCPPSTVHRPPFTVHRSPQGWGLLDLGSRLDEASGAFMDTAAVMMNLDLVISSDNAVPHLAGALGVPVWLALPLGPDWRWLLEREDSPWYPTMRLFRQTRCGQWEDVFDRMAEELKKVVSCQLSVVRKPI